MESHHFSIRGVTAVALVSLFLGACGGGGGEDAGPAPEVRQLPLDRLSVGAPLNGEARVVVLKESEADAGPYTATLSPADCGSATVDGLGVVVSGLKVSKCELTIRAAAAAASIPVEVFDPFVLITDELELAYTGEFTKIFDYGSFGHFYRPMHKDPGFLALGTAITASYDNIGTRVAPLVKPRLGSTAVIPTMEYETHVSGTVHRPVCPASYRSLGLVWTAVAEKPSYPTACIRNDLTIKGKTDRSTVFAYYVDLPDSPAPHTEYFVAPETAIGLGPGGIAGEDGYILKIKLPAIAEAAELRRRPRLRNDLCGPFVSVPIFHRTVRIPFTAVQNKENLSDRARAMASPFYLLERHVGWKMTSCYANNSDQEYARTYVHTRGISTTATETFQRETAIEISFEAGIEIGAFSSTIGTTLTTTFGYSRTAELSSFMENTVTDTWTVAPRATGAIFHENTWFRLHKYSGKEMILVDTTDVGGDHSTGDIQQFP